jgi:hypothetical protein
MKLVLALVAVFLMSGWTMCRAEHASIDLRISQREAATGTMKEMATAHCDTEPPAGGNNPRPLAKLQAKQPLVLQFIFTNTYPHGTIKAARVHYFVVRVDKINQKTLPDLTKDVVTQGSFELNFKPKGRAGARVEFTIPTPGIYLLRVQSENTDSDHEHFSAIDLQVE